MPSLGADMESGTVTKWRVAPGDQVHRGDIVLEVETEKATIEAEIFEDGTIDTIFVKEGEQVPVGAVLAHVVTQGAARPGEPRTPKAAIPQVRAIAVPVAPATAPVATKITPQEGLILSPLVRHVAEEHGLNIKTLHGSGPGGEITRDDVQKALRGRRGSGNLRRASPMARRRAEELHIDLDSLAGSGPQGAVVVADVEQAARASIQSRGRSRPSARVPAPTSTDGKPPDEELLDHKRRWSADQQLAMRHAIGALMARSKREIPHYYLESSIDFSSMERWLREANTTRPPTTRLLSATVLLKATALAARTVPEMNGFFVDDEFHASAAIHLGVAISLRQGGLIAPAIHDVDTLTLDELNIQLKDLVNRARDGRLRSSEMAEPTLTVTNLGDQGVEKVFGVIYPPQVALVGFGRVTERPFAHDGLIGAHPVITVTLSADHRVSDGQRGARFLSQIDRLLQQPEKL